MITTFLKMFKKFLKKIEDPKFPLLGPNIKCLKFVGLLLPESKVWKRIYILIHTLQTLFGVTQYMDIWYIKSDKSLLYNNLKTTMLGTVNVVKALSFLIWRKHWEEIINYVTKADLEQRGSSDTENHRIINKSTKYCRMVTYIYWSLEILTALFVIMSPIMKYILSPTYRENARNGDEAYVQIVNSWVPWDKTTLTGYVFACFYQIYAAILAVAWLSGFDATAIVIMVFFKGEMELLRRDSSKIFGSEEDPLDVEETQIRIKKCHSRHQEMIKFARLFDSCLSPCMLLYVIVCSIMLCVTSFQITTENSTTQRILIAEYFVFGVAQLFLYCWHANDVFYSSQDLYLGPYESFWYRKPVLRKDLILLMVQFRQTVVFSAGPFAKLVMPTFISILRGAYSFYTILIKSYQE